MDAGYTECCNFGSCLGVPSLSCYCDSTCHNFGDCCSDIEEICPRSSIGGKQNDPSLVMHDYTAMLIKERRFLIGYQ